ncbi:MAG: LysR family transcriptional regulator [Gammaproteobacteria bacterium]|nr:LysR family transcriptional regulator [Gammaproteobacteria bacterium]
MASWNRNISLRTLRTFCAAAQKESFREAAEQLCLTSSAVSHQIKHLESALGKKLFTRNPRSLALTDSGQALYADLHPALSGLDSIVEQHSTRQSRCGLRISVQPFFANELFVPRLHQFVAEHPEIDISIDTSDESLEKHPDTADISIRIFNSPPSSLACDRLFPLSLIPAGSPAFYDDIEVIGGRISSDFPLIVHESRPKAWRQWERTARLRIPRNAPTVRFDSMTAVVRAVERGMGAALVPERLSQSWFESNSLVQLFDHKLVTNDAYYLVCRPQDNQKLAVQSFRNWVLSNFADDG